MVVPRPVVLAHLDWQRPGDPRTGLGVASIAAATRAAGAPTSIVSDAVNRSGFDAAAWVEQVVATLQASGPDALLGVSAFVWNEPEVQTLMATARRETTATVVVGGPQVSYLPVGALERAYPDAHYLVRGHGEPAMVALATGDAGAGLGLHAAGDHDLGLRADVSLADLPSPYLDGTLRIERSLRWETQRGCPYACAFCQHREPGSRLRFRELGADRIAHEAQAFEAARVERLSVLDPIFHANPKRALQTLRAVRAARLGAQLSLQCRFELVDEVFLDALDGLDVALEFGLQTANEGESKVIGRHNRLDEVARAIEALHRRRVPFEVSLIYGLPTQTLSSFEASIAWCRAHGVATIRAWPLMLLRGTPLQAERTKWGFEESVGERIPIVVASDTFTREEHAEMARLARALEDPHPAPSVKNPEITS
jgi:radical SAM superfamily enzyme YgiQ (UPF0313 family)